MSYQTSLRGLQFLSLALAGATPWYFGSSPWQAQYYLGWSLLILALCTLPFLATSFLRNKSLAKPSFVSWVFVGLACIAFVQGREVYELQSDSQGPPSVQVQRWALGVDAAPPPIDQTQIALASFKPGEVPCDIQEAQSNSLARSLSPLHTKGASYALLLCGLLVWIGGLCFSERRQLPVLFLSLAIIGLLVGCLGIHGALSYKDTNYLGLKTASSYASFHSKNAAGAYLNIAIAAAVGLFLWSLSNLKRKRSDIRYRVEEEGSLMKLKSSVEDFFADLTTPQISALIVVVFLVVALVMSLCRGAVVGAGIGLVGAMLLANRGQRAEGGMVITLLLILAAAGAMIGFGVDDNSLARIESLAEFDLEADSINGRSYIWGIAWNAMWFYGLLGSGLGTFQYAYLPFQTPSSPGWFYRAESLYLQCGVDLGLLGLVAMLLALVYCFRKYNTRVSSESQKFGNPAKIAGMYLLVSLGVHAFVEHNLAIPAVFVSGTLLLGATLTAVTKARSQSSRHGHSKAKSSSATKGDEGFKFSAAIGGLVLVAVCVMFWFPAESALRNLAAGEVLDHWVEEQQKLELEEQEAKRFDALLAMWPLGMEELQKNPVAMYRLAEASVFEFRRAQLAQAPGNLRWKTIWQNTDPILLQIGLDRSASTREQEEVVRVAGGKPAVDLLKQASVLYTKAQLDAPLDWRLCWGRCLTALDCSRLEMARLLSPVDRLGRHVPTYMINAALLFRGQLEQDQLDQIWQQAMRVKPRASIAAAKNILTERSPEEINIDVFPKDPTVLISLAKTVFTKNEYPELFKQLWTRARELFTGRNLTPGEREIWLANAAFALDEADEELERLKGARRLLPRDASVAVRLAGLYRQRGELDTALAIVTEMLISDPENPELLRAQKQIRAAQIKSPK